MSIFLTVGADAAPLCQELFQPTSWVSGEVPKLTWEALFREMMLGGGGQSLNFDFTIPFPMKLKKVMEEVYQLVPSGKRNIQYSYDWSNPEDPRLRGTTTLFDRKAYDSEDLLHEIFSIYGPEYRAAIIVMIKQVEAILEREAPSRSEFGIVSGPGSITSAPIWGAVRMFNGTPGKYPDQRPDLPLKLAMLVRFGNEFVSKLKITQLSAKLTKENPNQEIFEWGKFLIGGPSRLQPKVRAVIELFLLRYYFERYPNAVFVAHVAKEAQLRRFMGRYRFRLLETIPIPNSKNVEYHIESTGAELAARIREIYLLPNPSYRVLPP